MAQLPNARTRTPYALMGLIAAQIFCAAFFVIDVTADFRATGMIGLHLWLEALAALTLLGAIVFEVRYFLRLLRRQSLLQRSASRAAQAMADVIEAHFEAWALTPAEHDVANLLVKGLPIAQIAQVRGSAEGTVKSQLNAIYRKSGAQNRGELLAVIIDSVMERDSLHG